ncbi:MAG: glycoside hydrolase family 24 [Rubrivivax sp. SCN 70-15]|nr:MAG: glycoside hydrolase family 24 [Rubrivivax sp. SCN 70-15]
MPAPLRDIPDDAVELIKSFEGIPDGDPRTVNIDPYLDPVGIWTIGWGHAIPAPGGGWLRGAANAATARALYPGGITKAQAELLLRGDLVDTGRDVQRLVKVPLDDDQFGALVSFTFNLGAGSLGQSTLLRKLNAGDLAGAADQFLAWNKGRVNGQLVVLPGLARRRTAERALFLGEDWRAAGRVRGAAKPKAVKPAAREAAKKAAAKKVAPKATKQAPKKAARPVAKKVAKPAAKKAVAVRPRGRTTTAKGLPPASSARPRGPRTPR